MLFVVALFLIIGLGLMPFSEKTGGVFLLLAAILIGINFFEQRNRRTKNPDAPTWTTGVKVLATGIGGFITLFFVVPALLFLVFLSIGFAAMNGSKTPFADAVIVLSVPIAVVVCGFIAVLFAKHSHAKQRELKAGK
jgi:hypothetical protein